MIDEYITSQIEKLVPQTVKQMLAPVLLLRDAPEVLDAQEVASLLKEDNVKNIYEACKRNELPHTHLGSKYKFSRVLLIKYLLNERFPLCEKCTRTYKPQIQSKDALSKFSPDMQKKILRFAKG